MRATLPLAALTPPERARRLRLLRDRAREPALRDALDWCARVAAAHAWLRHDPSCAHFHPAEPGPTRCTCGLERVLSAGPRSPPR